MTTFETEAFPDWLADVSVEQLENDPYPVFVRLRREAPIAWHPGLEANIASTWKGCWEIASDYEHFGGTSDPANEHVFGRPNVLSVDGDLHAGLRAMIDPQLRPRAVRGYIEDLARPIARRQIAALPDSGPAEMMSQYFEPVSVRALGDLLGFADVDSDRLRNWFHDLSTGFANKALRPEGFAVSDVITEEIRAVVEAKLERLRREPDNSSLSHWSAPRHARGGDAHAGLHVPHAAGDLAGRAAGARARSRAPPCSACCQSRTSCAGWRRTRPWYPAP